MFFIYGVSALHVCYFVSNSVSSLHRVVRTSHPSGSSNQTLPPPGCPGMVCPKKSSVPDPVQNNIKYRWLVDSAENLQPRAGSESGRITSNHVWLNETASNQACWFSTNPFTLVRCLIQIRYLNKRSSSNGT